jgi:hypothetical protein
MFEDRATESAAWDVVIQPNLGVIYVEPDDGFIEEHGGFTDEDTHVALLVCFPGLQSREVKSPVSTNQIAPTILEQLGLNPE